MRIGIITGEYPPLQGGVGDYTRAFAYALAEQGGIQVSILTGRVSAPDSGLPVSVGEPPGIQVWPLIERWDWRSMRKVVQWARAGNFDFVNLQFETAAYQMSPWVHGYPLLLRPIPVMTTFHDLKVPYLLPKAGRLRSAIVTLLARTSRLAITTNAADALDLRKRGITAIQVLPIGSNIPTVRPVDFDPIAWRAGITPNPTAAIIGYFGFMNASKGVDTLLEAVGMLRDQDHEVHLILIGGRTGSSDPENAAYAAQIEAQIGRLGLHERVHWTGFIDAASVSASLTSCDLIALPFVDGATLRRGSLMAALAHGAAIITTPAAPEEPLLKGAVAYTPVSDALGLARTIRRLLEDSTERAALKDSALRVSRQFEWPAIAQKFVQFATPLIDR